MFAKERSSREIIRKLLRYGWEKAEITEKYLKYFVFPFHDDSVKLRSTL